ncbi:torsin-1A-interacting protein 1-like [Anneissia japonica]|uniref:torsin-1A-interacting protein 1-like n=1 Tax=Anneissia japonica TaxID=1529436 RepID=UPI0014257BE2|nr:torsin-1A-interacting protein 1-like [Anneissia japonica]
MMVVKTRSKVLLGDGSLLKKKEYEKIKEEKEDEKKKARKKRKDTGDGKDLDKKRKAHILDDTIIDESAVHLKINVTNFKKMTRAEIPGKAKMGCEVTKQDEGKSHWLITVGLLMLFIVVVYHIFGVYEEDTTLIEYVQNSSSKEDFKVKLDHLRSSFSSQTPYFWKLIGSVSEDVIVSKNPKRPAVILLAGGPDAHQTLDNIASKLSTSYSHLDGNSGVIKIDGFQYKNTDPHNTKRLIDEELKNGFNTGRQVAIIHHFESIPAEASMIFHSYCENDNAPFKRVVIIFTVHMKEKLNPKDNIKINQKKVEQHLESQWKDAVDKDHIEAMFSRVATAVAFVTPE